MGLPMCGSTFTDTRVNWNLKIWASKFLTTSLGIKPWQKQRKASAFRFTEMVGKDNLDLSPIFSKAFTMIVMCYKYISEALNAFSFPQKLCIVTNLYGKFLQIFCIVL